MSKSKFKNGQKPKVNVTKGNPNASKKPHFKGKEYNDTSWYTKNAQLVVDTANIPFNQSLDRPLDVLDTNRQDGQPILMSFAHDWLVGNQDSLTVAARQIWADVRKVNSGATNYEGSDILSILIAAADVFINITWLSTFFGIAGHFNPRDKTAPRALFESGSIDYNDFIANLADYRARFNKLMLRARSITIPKKYPWIEAAMALYANVFKDEDTDTGREQLYIIHKAAFYQLKHHSEDAHYTVSPITLNDMETYYHAIWNNYAASDARRGTTPEQYGYQFRITDGVVTAAAGPGAMPIKFSFYLDILDLQINSIITDETANIIQGDLMKAFGDVSAYTTGQIDSSFEIKPHYSEEFGWYLHNATIYGSPVREAGRGVTTPGNPGTGTHICPIIGWFDPNVQAPLGYYKEISQVPGNNRFDITLRYEALEVMCSQTVVKSFRPILDTNKLNPSPEEVIWYTRGVNFWNGDKFNDKNSIISNGILLNMRIWFVTESNWGDIDPQRLTSILTKNMFMELGSGLPSVKELEMISQFNWAPIIYKLQGNAADNCFLLPIGDLNNPTTVDRNTIRKINDIVLLSLFDIPNR